ncbi:halocarboxylic acid dehydrogenase DehI family protein [Allohahella sp. A8]|uniref:halocarboxylic acid dehydrogenase DehI family protein n=1 Tax=Allohahella sp. A8 TaxID=3141461 RepID=UPI000C0A8FC7|nr:hypothetical protein [Hahellaceae bacterium]|tara:strand:- start:13445 stop:14341 length:897 start_codon:yes stop_codon:yes gene_type:complete
MDKQTEDATERGLKLAADLPDLTMEQVDDCLQAIYEDIQQSLRVPIVNQLFRTLANYPDFLEQAWRAVKPVVRSVAFERAADDLRQKAVLDAAPATTSLGVSGIMNADKLIDFNDTIHYVLPKLLLISAAFNECAFGDRLGNAAFSLNEIADLPRGIADGTGKVELVDPAEADAALQALFERIRQDHGHPMVSSYYRGIAQWPDFLDSAWRLVGQEVVSQEYRDRRSRLVDAAQAHVRSWPLGRIDVQAGQQSDIQDILAGFQLKFIPEMLLDVVLIKALLEGKAGARHSRFSVADEV